MSSPEVSGVTDSISNLSIITTDDQQEEEEDSGEAVTPRQPHPLSSLQDLELISKRERGKPADKHHSGSGTERESPNKMPSGSSSKHHHSSSSKHGSSSSRHQPKSDDWSDVTEPDERRRIQNRIAQRKFRKYLPPPHRPTDNNMSLEVPYPMLHWTPPPISP